MNRRSKLSAVALTLILTISCGGGSALKSFRLALASSGPLVNSLVLSGAIPESKATAIIADFDAGAQCGVTLQNDFSAIPVDLPEREKTARKFEASSAALKCFRTIIDHRNFAAHPKVQTAANIAEGILASLVIFYSDPGEVRASAGGTTVIVKTRNERDLEKQLKKQVEALKEAMKP